MVDHFIAISDYDIQPTLDRLKKRLKKGMVLHGRIIECISTNKYLLRVWGYNILTESRGKFQKFDEIDLFVNEIFPNIEFELSTHSESNNGQMDIFI